MFRLNNTLCFKFSLTIGYLLLGGEGSKRFRHGRNSTAGCFNSILAPHRKTVASDFRLSKKNSVLQIMLTFKPEKY